MKNQTVVRFAVTVLAQALLGALLMGLWKLVG